MAFRTVVVALCLLLSVVSAAVLPAAFTRTDVLVHPGAPAHPPHAVAVANARAAPLPAPTVTFHALPTLRAHTGTRVEVSYEPIEQHGYIVRF